MFEENTLKKHYKGLTQYEMLLLAYHTFKASGTYMYLNCFPTDSWEVLE